MNKIPEIIDEIREGRMVVMVDDEDRENEGDLIMAASMVRPEDINFMARHARGLICLPLTRDRCRQLNLPLMVNSNRTRYGTNFTVSIEAAEGVTTGISAYDRAHTIRTAVRPNAGPHDVAQPGHVFPLMSQPGGVLTRAGHTEAAVDLACLAGLEPAGVLVEILNEDGTMARRPQLEAFAAEHDLKIGTIADLIHHRLETEKTIARVAEREVQTEFGPFRLLAYRDVIKKQLHLALVRGAPAPTSPTLVRVHVRSTLSDVLQVDDPTLGLPIRIAQRELAASSDPGVLVVLGEDESADSVIHRLQTGSMPNINKRSTQATAELRNYGIGAQILADLGVGRMRVLSAPKRFHGLSGFGLEVIEYVEPEGAENMSSEEAGAFSNGND
ncbi:MAG: bifunctional 3,4-dihydroxy-2-butanone-4-phosphate synthase/GTP cyclohydrolase II [Xanthomonadales bacterium]|nr:bifunctional 3,4-dihydroxy-2-butanone-4-phosphate synthase/GTP cyclohydrolase II [Xanthomonadales bacterium]